MHTVVYPARFFLSPVWDRLNLCADLLRRRCGMHHTPVYLSSYMRVLNARQVRSFLVMQESNSCVLAYFIPTAYAVGIHSFSAASAGAVATMATHPFDVIKVISSGCLTF